MTVSSLWKALNRGGCGKQIGEKELASGRTKADLSRINPWTRAAALHANHQTTTTTTQHTTTANNKSNTTQTLAVDLSIWICESLTSVGMAQHHANPALHLVFSRTVKLLSLGIKLIFVVEGKSRVRTEMGDDDRFRKRRSGTAFWKACNDCQKMLELLGVPVVRAKAEGEALCALLSQRGIVDGVISNDGDCLLFGAKIIYTKFSLENLENGCVVRYDLDNLRAVAEKSDEADDNDDAANPSAENDTPTESVVLSRKDLVVFALLTGSDLAGSGLAKVGHKKAVRFIRKCKLDNPLMVENAALEEMQAWARAASSKRGVQVDMVENEAPSSPKKKKAGTCCSRCCHAGSKRSHLKHGCESCGTKPGEPCFKVTSDDRFRKSLRSKALAMVPKFEPSKVLQTYMVPNENQLPYQLAHTTKGSLQMTTPRLRDLMQTNLIIKGRDRLASRTYVQNAVGRLLSRAELLRPRTDASHQTSSSHNNRPDSGTCKRLPRDRPIPTDSGTCKRLPRDRPIPTQIQKALVQKGVPCFEVLWKVNATVTDENGEGMDGYEYNTVESRQVIQERYPQLVDAFAQAERERTKQGDGEQMRRQEFLETFLFGRAQAPTKSGKSGGGILPAKRKAAHIKAREGFFLKNNNHNTAAQAAKKARRHARQSGGGGGGGGGEDVENMLRFLPKPVFTSPVRHHGGGQLRRRQGEDEDDNLSSLHSGSPWPQEEEENYENHAILPNQQPSSTKKRSRFFAAAQAAGVPSLTPSKELFCNMGDVLVPLSPIDSNQGAFPPRHIFLYQKKRSHHHHSQ